MPRLSNKANASLASAGGALVRVCVSICVYLPASDYKTHLINLNKNINKSHHFYYFNLIVLSQSGYTHLPSTRR